MQLPLLILAPSLVAAAVPAIFARGCGDNCARAVIASAYTTRSGAADCSSFLKTTVTPATSIIVETVTLSFTVQATESVTSTTLTTTTVVESNFETVRETTTVSTTKAEPVPINKRQQTSQPSNIPAYASACSGAARYSTACACVGVFPTTITAPTPRSTQTIYVSVSSTVTETLTVSTEVDVLTATNTVQATATLTETATATATVQETRVRLRAQTGPHAGKYVMQQVYYDTPENYHSVAILMAVPEAEATWFIWDGQHLYIDTPTAGRLPVKVFNQQGGPVSGLVMSSQKYLDDLAFILPSTILPCDISNHRLHCWIPLYPTSDRFFQHIPNGDLVLVSRPDADNQPQWAVDEILVIEESTTT